jgi:quercetin dioxygenase-like cupin family protein
VKKCTISANKGDSPREGVKRKVIRGDTLEFVQYTYEGGSTFPVHSHRAEQITWVVSGELVFRTPDSNPPEEITLSPGEIVVIPSDEPHGASVPDSCEETVTCNVFSNIRKDLPG